MKTFKTVRISGIFITLLIFALSCATGEKGKKRHKKDDFFPKIKNCVVSLEVVSSSREFYPGEDVSITFRLKNTGKKHIIIYEWIMKESDNITLYYRPYSPDIKKFDKAEWTELKPKLLKDVKRAPLTLNPGNSTLVTKKLSFIKDIKPYMISGDGLSFYVVAELNLTSLSARSRAVIVRVR